MTAQNMKKIRIITGPTASGKTRRTIDLAKSINGEIINCDSLQVYKDLKILTSFPTSDEMAEVKHKLFGYLEYYQKTSAVEWSKLAAIEIEKTSNSGKVPIIVGGTGLYIKTLIDGISPIPEVSQENRQRTNELASRDFEQLCEILYKLDPELIKSLPKSKHHQLIRAYEIFLETGKSIRHFWDLPTQKFIDEAEFEIELVNCDRAELYNRIEKRFDEMIQNGAIDEVSALLGKIDNPNHEEIFQNYPIFKAIGAKEIALYLDGFYSFEQMRELSIKNSKHYAKRQITWFRHQIDI